MPQILLSGGIRAVSACIPEGPHLERYIAGRTGKNYSRLQSEREPVYPNIGGERAIAGDDGTVPRLHKRSCSLW